MQRKSPDDWLIKLPAVLTVMARTMVVKMRRNLLLLRNANLPIDRFSSPC
jgi:hypothetical protein